VQKLLRKSTCKKSSLATSYGSLEGPIWNFTRIVLDPLYGPPAANVRKFTVRLLA
jgi:hypothetical protein